MIGAIIMAAGAGQRFGYAHKLLAPLAGRPMIAQILASLNSAPVRPIVLVTGRRHAAIASVGRRNLRPAQRLRVVRNTDYREGMARSLKLGIQALPQRCDAALVCLADMPFIHARSIKLLCQAWQPGLDYLRPTYAQRPGHPVIISHRLFGKMATLNADQGAQHILAKVPDERYRLLTGNKASLLDIDTPSDLRRGVRQLEIPRDFR